MHAECSALETDSKTLLLKGIASAAPVVLCSDAGELSVALP